MSKEIEKLLPEWCYVYLPSTGGLGIVNNGNGEHHSNDSGGNYRGRNGSDHRA